MTDSLEIPLTIDSRQTLTALCRETRLSDSAALEMLAVATEDAIARPYDKKRKSEVPESCQLQHFARVTPHVHARWCRLAEIFDMPLEAVVGAVLNANASRLGRAVDTFHPSWRRLMLRLRG